MFVTSAAMATPAKNSYLVYKVAFFQNSYFYNSRQRYLQTATMFKIIFTFTVLTATACCSSKKTGSGANNVSPEAPTKDSIPACVRKLIDDAGKEIPPNLPVQVDEYIYTGKKVFLFTAQCCDQFDVVYDESCKRICAPSGGITGKGDMTCNDFSEKAKFVKNVWKNPAIKSQ